MYRDGTGPTALTERLLAEEHGYDEQDRDGNQSPEEIADNRWRNVKSAIIADALWTLADSIWAGGFISRRLRVVLDHHRK